MANFKLIYNTLGGVVMSDIDIERLKWDADYWDEVAPEWAMVYLHHYVRGGGCFASAHKKDATAAIAVTGEIDCFNLAPDCWKDPIPRPTKQEWEGGLPTVGCECEVKNDNGDWHECFVVGHHRGCAVFFCDSWTPDSDYDALPASEFRPLRTKQQRLRDELARVIRESDDMAYSLRPDDIADAILSSYTLEEK